jgi:hypothetical protein
LWKDRKIQLELKIKGQDEIFSNERRPEKSISGLHLNS